MEPGFAMSSRLRAQYLIWSLLPMNGGSLNRWSLKYCWIFSQWGIEGALVMDVHCSKKQGR